MFSQSVSFLRFSLFKTVFAFLKMFLHFFNVFLHFLLSIYFLEYFLDLFTRICGENFKSLAFFIFLEIFLELFSIFFFSRIFLEFFGQNFKSLVQKMGDLLDQVHILDTQYILVLVYLIISYFIRLYSSNSEVKSQYSSLNNYNSSFISHYGYSTIKRLSSLFLVQSADGVVVCTYQIKQFILFRN